MTRLIKKQAKGPIEIKPSDKSIYVCACGLSKNQPFCDGSHQRTLDEEDGKIYSYNSDGTRQEVS